MENTFCQIITDINWVWFLVSVVITFGIGAIWYSLLFSKAWIQVFKVEMSEKPSMSSFISTMLLQLIASALLGLVFFILDKVSVWIAILALVGFCGWQKATLRFQFANWKNFVQAVWIQVGYTCLAGITFILFGLV